MAIGMPTASGLKPYEQALLNAIAAKESAGKYNVRYSPQGGATFNGFDQHPGIYEPGPAGPSSAAGRYQFVKSTWDRLPAEAKGDGSFSPENQDRAALWLARNDYKGRTGGDLDSELQAGGLTPAHLKALAPTWAAFGSQGNHQGILNTYNQTLNGGVPSTTEGAGSGPPTGDTSGADAAPAAAPTPSLTSKFLSGGPGALFGNGQEDWNLGDAMLGAGASLMMRDNPQAGAALMAYMSKSRENKRKNALENLGFTPNKKQLIMRDPQSGAISYQSIPDTGTATEPEKAPDKTIETFSKTNREYLDANTIAEDSHTIRDAILNKGLKFDAWNNVQDAFKNYSGNADEASRTRVALERLKQTMLTLEQQKQSGVQTEGDAKRYLQKYWPSAANFDSTVALENLDKLHGEARKDISNFASQNKSFIKKYGELDAGTDVSGAPIKYSERYDGDIKRWNDLDKEYAPQRDAFIKRQQTAPGKSTGPSEEGFKKWFGGRNK